MQITILAGGHLAGSRTRIIELVGVGLAMLRLQCCLVRERSKNRLLRLLAWRWQDCREASIRYWVGRLPTPPAVRQAISSLRPCSQFRLP